MKWENFLTHLFAIKMTPHIHTHTQYTLIIKIDVFLAHEQIAIDFCCICLQFDECDKFLNNLFSSLICLTEGLLRLDKHCNHPALLITMGK